MSEFLGCDCDNDDSNSNSNSDNWAVAVSVYECQVKKAKKSKQKFFEWLKVLIVLQRAFFMRIPKRLLNYLCSFASTHPPICRTDMQSKCLLRFYRDLAKDFIKRRLCLAWLAKVFQVNTSFLRGVVCVYVHA